MKPGVVPAIALSSRSHRLQALAAQPELWLLATGLVLSLLRLWALSEASREVLECRWCVAVKAVPHELQFNALLAALYLLSTVPRWRALRWATRSLVVGLLLIALVDLAVLRLFYMRLSADLVLKFGSEAGATESFVRQLIPGLWQGLALAAAALLAIGAAAAFVRRDPPRRYSAWAILCPASVAFAMAQSTPTDYHRDYLKNAAEAFFSFGTRTRPYSDDFVRQTLGGPSAPQPATPQACSAGLAQRPALILLVVESLSVYQSKLISGLNDWTPELDALAREDGLRLPNFFANGIDTEAGLIALLTGEPPMARGGDAATVFEAFARPKQSIPSMLSARGYRSAFLTTGDLGFLDKRRWLQRIGFDVVEGHEAAFYSGMKRLHFSAAPDAALYDRALQYMDQRDAGQPPLFLMLETVSTHHPYVEPNTGARSQEAVFRYADHEIGEFVKDLKARRFFDHGNGYLMVVGDHRAMVPMRPDERERYGDSAYARVPFIMLGEGLGGRVEPRAFSQNDLLPSLRHWIGSGPQCTGPNQGVFLPTATHAPRCIYTLRRYSTNDVFLQCDDRVDVVHLDGDRTRYVGASAGSPGQLAELNRLRMNGGF